MALIQKAIRTKEGQKKPTRYFSSKQEARVAKEFNGSQTKNSGATMFQKADVLLDDFCIECKTKTSDSKQIAIHKEWLEKNEAESLYMGKRYSALMFNFGPSDQKNYVILDEDTFKELIDNGKSEQD